MFSNLKDFSIRPDKINFFFFSDIFFKILMGDIASSFPPPPPPSSISYWGVICTLVLYFLSLRAMGLVRHHLLLEFIIYMRVHNYLDMPIWINLPIISPIDYYCNCKPRESANGYIFLIIYLLTVRIIQL